MERFLKNLVNQAEKDGLGGFMALVAEDGDFQWSFVLPSWGRLTYTPKEEQLSLELGPEDQMGSARTMAFLQILRCLTYQIHHNLDAMIKDVETKYAEIELHEVHEARH